MTSIEEQQKRKYFEESQREHVEWRELRVVDPNQSSINSSVNTTNSRGKRRKKEETRVT
jgi:hypothetical protein